MGKVYLWAVGPQFVFIYIADAVQYMSVQQWAECHCPVSTRQSSKKPITRCVDAHFDVQY